MKIVISDHSIKLGQLLKKINLISSGGEAKAFIKRNIIKINGKPPTGRNTKVIVGATLWINDDLYQVVNE